MMMQAGMQPDAWQARVLRNRYQRLLLNCSRQAGKSTVIACVAALEALFRAPSLTLILSPSERQSKELFRDVTTIWQKLGAAIDPDSQTTTSVDFATGSRIVALPSNEKNVRGFKSVALLVIDEASRVPDELYKAVRPMLAVSGGRIVCLSTPFGKRGFFYREWVEGSGWERIQITADQVTRISPAFLAEEKIALPDSFFRQEYMCEFADTDDAVFRYDDLAASLSDDVRPLYGLPAAEEGEVKPLFQ